MCDEVKTHFSINYYFYNSQEIDSTQLIIENFFKSTKKSGDQELIYLQKVKKINFSLFQAFRPLDFQNADRRKENVDAHLVNNELKRTHADSQGNNCLLDSIYPQIVSFFKSHYSTLIDKFTYSDFVRTIRAQINRPGSIMLSLNDEEEGKKYLNLLLTTLTKRQDCKQVLISL